MWSAFVVVMLGAGMGWARHESGEVGYSDDYTTLLNNINATYLTNCASACSAASSYVDRLLPNGTWADIDYNDKSRNTWAPCAHWNRLASITAAYRCGGCPSGNGNMTYMASYHQGNVGWFKLNPMSDNWWWNDLGLNFALGQAAVPIIQELTSTEKQEYMSTMRRATWWEKSSTWTGENVVWALQIQVRLGLIQNDESLIDQAFSVLWGNITISTDPTAGVQPDHSFHQHGTVVQTATYGEGFSTDSFTFLQHAANTKWAITSEARMVLSDFVLDGQREAMRRGMDNNWRWNVVVKGREITRPPIGSLSIEPTTWSIPMRALAQGASRSQELLAFADALDGKGEQWRGGRWMYDSDYAMHGRSDYLLGLKLWSSRTESQECVNDEGQRSWYFSEGMHLFQRSGVEFDSIFPVWNWTVLPGVTARQGVENSLCGAVKQLGPTNAVGGVHDGDIGVASYEFESGNFGGTGESSARVVALKSYFMLDPGLIVLISNLSLPETKASSLTTGLEQNILQETEGDFAPHVSINGGSATPIPIGNQTLSSVSWLSHNGTIYTPFPTPHDTTSPVWSTIQLTVGQQWGSWQRISTSQSPTPLSRNVFLAAINHGPPPIHAPTFAYAVLPTGSGASTAPSTINALQSAAKITASSTTTHALTYSNSSHDACLVVAWSTAAAAPCFGNITITKFSTALDVTLLREKSTGQTTISFAQPSHGTGNVSFSILGASLSSASSLCSAATDAVTVAAPLPGAPNSGGPVQGTCTLNV